MTRADDGDGHLAQATRHLRAAASALEAAFEVTSKVPLNTSSNAPLSPPSTSSPDPVETAEDPNRHRREHRTGYPSKLDTDPELRAFVLARIDTMSFPQLEAAIADNFPPDRRLRKTALNDWWTRNMAHHRRP